jgi:benzylsuccinate CoA-transferase BbsF subunit
MNGGEPYIRTGNRVPFAAPHGVYRMRGEDEWLAIACLEDAQWEALATVAGHPEWLAEPRFATLEARKAHEDDLDARVGDWCASLDGPDAMARLHMAGVPAGLALRASEVLADPHLQTRGYFRWLDHAEAGRRAYDGPGFRLSKTAPRLDRAAPLLGEHTHEVASTILGLTDDEIATLVAEGVLV